MLVKWDATMQGLMGRVGGPYQQALSNFNKLMDDQTASLVKMMGLGLSAADALRMYNEVVDAGTKAMQESIAVDMAKNDLADDYIQKLLDSNAALLAYTNEHRSAVEIDKMANDAIEKQRDLYGQWYPTIEEATAAVNAQKPALICMTSNFE